MQFAAYEQWDAFICPIIANTNYYRISEKKTISILGKIKIDENQTDDTKKQL